MPRILDAAARDRAVIDAAWQVIAREGITALTVRRVAAQAGLAPSSLRYTFPSQAVVREKAIIAVSEHLSGRVAALPAGLTGRAWARAALLELLPLDQQRRLEMEVFLAFGMAALADETLQPLWNATDAVVRDVCARAIEAAKGEAAGGEAGPHLDRLHALVDGLAFHLLVRPDQQDGWAQTVIDRELDSLL
ncbi:AcrR family transcriptional regulator [Actinoplanes lutulentus]|uniref:TetR family transcriptional regulator n=1 Tax=Actinoplanes lutulentus TaxID=1287878 RepID=A0A327Z1T1_9ACTN|nr:TetR family transcriptional regulator C-terminal domain-containing protein [Actinoplanes lutulentus]MBB2947673.1 AcrR family transcriptional regulator [Actinoplanes lutulentus]RAK27729.1 TetR family transcriptional regulator [Actinoplanes lutulentus]